ncbi:DEAD/DEAH box helicase family protein [candidate division KSB1 bacterium]|nr:DEAD/DEAH box helicase family protein [candidate division KSB1 bacterium]
MNEADTCRTYIVPKLQHAGWENEPHRINEQVTFTDGRIIVLGNKIRRGKQKRADYILRYTRDFPIAVVEAKASYKTPGAGLQQAKEYANILGLEFAYSSNGAGIIEFNFSTGLESELVTFPTPVELMARLQKTEKLDDAKTEHLLTPLNIHNGKIPRYYQEIAINRIVQNVLNGKRRILVTMATGTGKTIVAYQVCWKLWQSRWNRTGEYRRPKILYLADRNILVDDPKDKTFVPFGEARHKIENGEVVKSREMYFAIYQSIAEDERRPGLYRKFSQDFFDLIIIDECHRGSASSDGNWREILDYFKPAIQLGMTATPLRDDNRDTYAYFGNPVYTYSLRQGIADGFLAPYRVHRIVTTVDATGWRPSKGELDRYGREIPDEEYHTKDFERTIALRARTKAIANHITTFLKANNRFDKTIVFCVDQEHADEMRRALNNLNSDLVQEHPNYVCRVTSDEGGIGRKHLSDFQELETIAPVILTTSQLLTTGVDAPMVKNVCLVRIIGSMSEFKQIIGRGTRVRDDYGKYYFNILDYTGSATQHFADPEFDGEPELVAEIELDDDGNIIDEEIIEEHPDDDELDDVKIDDDEIEDDEEIIIDVEPPIIIDPPPPPPPRKLYIDGGHVEIAVHAIHDLDASGKKLRVVEYMELAAESIKKIFPTAAELRYHWAQVDERNEIIEMLAEKGIDFDELIKAAKQPDADPFDLLCYLAYNAPLRTRRERAERLRQNKTDFFDKYGKEARTILHELLDKYTDFGFAQFKIPDIFKVPPISNHGNISEIINLFGGVDPLKEAIADLQKYLYAS